MTDVNSGDNTLRFKKQEGVLRAKSKQLGDINTSEIKGGVHKSEITDQAFIPLFDLINTTKNNGNEILDASEIKAFVDVLIKQAKNDKELANGDVDDIVNYLKKNALGYGLDLSKIKIEDLYNFVEQLLQASGDVESSVIDENNAVRTTFTSGAVETINQDGTGTVTYTDENGNSVVESMSAERSLTKKVITGQEGSTTKTTTVVYTQGIPATTTVVEADGETVNNTIVITHDEKGAKKTAVLTNAQGVVSEYFYVGDVPVINKKTEPLEGAVGGGLIRAV